MLTKLPWQKLSQASATTALGLAMLAAIESTPASAAQLQEFKISGTFGNEDFIVRGVYGIPNSEDDPYSYAHLDYLANTSFEGSFTVDLDKLPDNGYDVSVGGAVQNWDVLGGSFYSPQPVTPPDFANWSQNLVFTDGYYTDLTLFIDSNSRVTSTGRPLDVRLGVPVYGIYEQYANKYSLGEAIYITSFRIEPAPEPFTIGGTAVAGAMALWLKRKQKASKAV